MGKKTDECERKRIWLSVAFLLASLALVESASAVPPKGPSTGKIILAILIIAGAAYYWFVMKKGRGKGGVEVAAPEEVQEAA